MAGAKIIVIYLRPTDIEAFDKRYQEVSVLLIRLPKSCHKEFEPTIFDFGPCIVEVSSTDSTCVSNR